MKWKLKKILVFKLHLPYYHLGINRFLYRISMLWLCRDIDNLNFELLQSIELSLNRITAVVLNDIHKLKSDNLTQ